MLRTYLHLPSELDQQISNLAKVQNRPKAKVIREVLKQGLAVINSQKDSGIETMLKLAEIGKKYKLKGPRDGSARLDDYLWGNRVWKNE